MNLICDKCGCEVGGNQSNSERHRHNAMRGLPIDSAPLAEVAALRDENQRLREENARLLGRVKEVEEALRNYTPGFD